MATAKEIEAATIAVLMVGACGFTIHGERVPCTDPRAAEMIRHTECECRKMAAAALEAAERIKDAERIANCKHPRRTGTGGISSDGSGYSQWFCPDCGKSAK